jgi:hypothetical protein
MSHFKLCCYITGENAWSDLVSFDCESYQYSGWDNAGGCRGDFYKVTK